MKNPSRWRLCRDTVGTGPELRISLGSGLAVSVNTANGRRADLRFQLSGFRQRGSQEAVQQASRKRGGPPGNGFTLARGTQRSLRSGGRLVADPKVDSGASRRN